MTYTPKQFEELVKEFTEKEEQILGWKAGEYTTGEDRLMNFRQIADFLETRPSKVALMYLLKHIQSITLAVQYQRYNWAWETPEGEGLKQRISDVRNYLLLLAACLDEEAGGDE